MLDRITKMDWETPLFQTEVWDHWRIFVTIVICHIPSIAIWNYKFPNVLSFYTFWCGSATGLLVGLILGYIWQLLDKKRVSRSSGKLLLFAGLAFSLFTIIALTSDATDLKRAEFNLAKVRSFTVDDIQRIEILYTDRPFAKIEDHNDIASFVRLTEKAELYHPSHELIILEFRLCLVLTDGTSLYYPAEIRERHFVDIALEYYSHEYILIPRGKVWLDSCHQISIRKFPIRH